MAVMKLTLTEAMTYREISKFSISLCRRLKDKSHKNATVSACNYCPSTCKKLCKLCLDFGRVINDSPVLDEKILGMNKKDRGNYEKALWEKMRRAYYEALEEKY